MCIIAFFVIRDIVIPLSIYNKGVKLLVNKQYIEAINTLTQVYETKDAQEKIVQAEKELLKQAKVGDIVLFGKCSQTESIRVETPIEWIVIDSTDEELLLLSKLAIEMMVVPPGKSLYKKTQNFKESLDSSYESYFSPFEREIVQPTKSPQFEGMNLFILDDVEIKKYFPEEEFRKLQPTAYCYTYSGSDGLHQFHGYIPWLTIERKDGDYKEIDYMRSSDAYDYYGIRPAIWVEVERE